LANKQKGIYGGRRNTTRKKGFLGSIGSGFKTAAGGVLNGVEKVLDVVTYPTQKLDEAVEKRVETLNNDRNDGWAKVAEVGNVLTSATDKSLRGFAASGGQPAGAAYGGGRALVSETMDLVNGQNPTMRRLEKSGHGSREDLVKEFEDFAPKFANDPIKEGEETSVITKAALNGVLGRDGFKSAALSHFEDFKKAGGNMLELSKTNLTIDEYLDKKQQQLDKEAETAPRAIPVEGEQRERKPLKMGGPRADAEGAIEKQNSDGVGSDMDRAMAQADGVDKSGFQMTQDGTALGAANGDPNVGRSAPATRSGEVGLA
jgi:hypothetical protein